MLFLRMNKCEGYKNVMMKNALSWHFLLTYILTILKIIGKIKN